MLSVSRPFEPANVILGFNAIGREDERRFPLGALSTIVGGGSSSRLFQEVREERGTAYSVCSYPIQPPTPAPCASGWRACPASSTRC